MRRAAVLALSGTLLPVALLLSACGAQQADPQASEQSGRVSPSNAPSVPKGTDSAEAGSAERESVPVEHEPSVLPPGDPGLDAPPAPDPGVPEDDRDAKEPALTKVPDAAMLDTQTVSVVRWRTSDTNDACAAPWTSTVVTAARSMKRTASIT